MGRTLADKMREDVLTVFLRTDHFAGSFTYVSPLEGTKPVNAIKTEHGSGPENHQHSKTLTRRATFQIAESLTDGVRIPREGDSIVDDTGAERITWGLADSKTMKLEAGMWSIEFVSAQVTAQGFRQAAGL